MSAPKAVIIEPMVPRKRHLAEPSIVGVDLFCGLGGLTHGLIRGNVRIVAGVDSDPACRHAYEANNAGARFIEEDIRALTGDDLDSLYQQAPIRLLAGCAPCQPFSTYSQKGRQARTDPKWDLLTDFARLIEETRPELVTMENVPQLKDHSVFENFARRLRDYWVWCDIVSCERYGVPQTRKRLVLLASRLGPISIRCPSHSSSEEVTVREAIGHLRPIAAGEADPDDPLHAASALSSKNLERIRASRQGGTWRDWDVSLRATCHQKGTGDTYPSVYGRMSWDSLAPTVTTQCFGYGNGRFGHPEQDRAISLREAAILQTFPAAYRFLRDGERPRFNKLGRLIGNAVPVRLGEVVGESLTAHVAASVASKQ